MFFGVREQSSRFRKRELRSRTPKEYYNIKLFFLFFSHPLHFLRDAN